MNAIRPSIIIAAALLGGCASGDSLESGRTVFNNPYAAPAIDRTGIGPQCNVDLGRDATCLGGPLIYPGKGRHVSLGHGEVARLTRAQARILRERGALIEARSNQPPALPQPLTPPSPQPDLPTAGQGSGKPI